MCPTQRDIIVEMDQLRAELARLRQELRMREFELRCKEIELESLRSALCLM